MNEPWLRAVLALCMSVSMFVTSPLVTLAQVPAPAPSEPEQSLARSRELIKEAQYDQAIELLQGAIHQLGPRPELLREAYLLLVKTVVFDANYLMTQPNGRAAADQMYDKAERLIAECLTVRELRHTRPEPASDYPAEMIQRFRDVRARMFGGVRLGDVSPAGALVMLGADTLKRAGSAGAFEMADVPVGEHLLSIRFPGYRP